MLPLPASAASTNPAVSLVDAVLPMDGARARHVRNLLLAVGGSLLLWLAAKLKLELGFVNMTMQTFAVLLIGAAYGSRLGAATVLLYLAQGAAGLPVFTGTPEKGLGIAYMAGPTGGYLVGFVCAAFVVGFLCERGAGRALLTAAVAMLAGLVVLYIPGIAWLAVLLGFEKAIAFGLLPFLGAEALKLALAACCLPLAWRILR